MPFRLPIRLNREHAEKLIRNVDNFLFDCDGVIWDIKKPIEGSVEFINKLKNQYGKKCFFITNNSNHTREDLLNKLKKVGIENLHENDAVCTSWVLAGYLKTMNFKDKVYVIGNVGMGLELDKAEIRHTGIGPSSFQIGAHHSDYTKLPLDPEVKCVCVGFDPYFNYVKLVEATSYGFKKNDCLFLATNDDAQFPCDAGARIVIPGTGTLVNSVKTSVGRQPIILGKPYTTMWEVLSKINNLDPERSCMVGDRLDTDIAFAANNSLGYSLAVLSGVSTEDEILDLHEKVQKNKLSNDTLEAKCVPDYYANSLGEFNQFI
jgi:phosphoglycolate/pyridoxal phosphate phosphatase family enzyme